MRDDAKRLQVTSGYHATAARKAGVTDAPAAQAYRPAKGWSRPEGAAPTLVKRKDYFCAEEERPRLLRRPNGSGGLLDWEKKREEKQKRRPHGPARTITDREKHHGQPRTGPPGKREEKRGEEKRKKKRSGPK